MHSELAPYLVCHSLMTAVSNSATDVNGAYATIMFEVRNKEVCSPE